MTTPQQALKNKWPLSRSSSIEDIRISAGKFPAILTKKYFTDYPLKPNQIVFPGSPLKI